MWIFRCELSLQHQSFNKINKWSNRGIRRRLHGLFGLDELWAVCPCALVSHLVWLHVNNISWLTIKGLSCGPWVHVHQAAGPGSVSAGHRPGSCHQVLRWNWPGCVMYRCSQTYVSGQMDHRQIGGVRHLSSAVISTKWTRLSPILSLICIGSSGWAGRWGDRPPMMVCQYITKGAKNSITMYQC